MALARRVDRRWRSLALVSLVFTSASGIQAIAFFALQHDFEVAWWIPNVLLLACPAPYVVWLVRSP